MRHRIQPLLIVVFLVTAVSILCCDEEEELMDITLTGQRRAYSLTPVSNSGIGGTITLEERTDYSTLVTINLDGTNSGNIHPAHFYTNSTVETGDIIIDLNSVDGTTGKSETIVYHAKNGNQISFNQLLVLDVHVNIAFSRTDLNTLIAQADTGGNETTGTFKSYTLSSATDSDISGTAQFIKRVNGTTLVVVQLNGVSETGSYLAFICNNDLQLGGSVVVTLNSVHGELGNSFTNVAQLNDGRSISYDQLLHFDGHVRVATNEAVPKCMAQANIGGN